MTTYLLDTNTVIYILKAKSMAARTRLASLSSTEIACISTITEAEMLYGIAKSGAASARRQEALNNFLSRIRVIPWGREEAACYGPLRANQEATGKPLGALDMQIAAHALALHAVLVTRDKAFHQVAGLPGIENWATDL